MPIIWIMFILIICRCKSIYIYFKIIFILLFFISIPIVIEVIQIPLSTGAAKYKDSDNISAIAVLTGGAYKDINNKWHPSAVSVKRTILADKIAKKLDKPLIIIGGSNNIDGTAESVLVSRIINNNNVFLDTESRNTHESAKNFKSLLRKNNFDINSNYLIITSNIHNLRTALTFKSQGNKIKIYDYLLLHKIEIKSFIPTSRSFLLFNKALYEYFGIIQYILLGIIKF